MHFPKLLISAYGMKLKLGSVMRISKRRQEMASFYLRRIKCLIYRLDIIFSKTQLVQLMGSKINVINQRNIHSTNSNFIPYQEVEK